MLFKCCEHKRDQPLYIYEIAEESRQQQWVQSQPSWDSFTVRPSTSPSIAVTSCHDYPLTSLVLNGQCKWQYNNPPKKSGPQTIRSEPFCPVRLLVHRHYPTIIFTHSTANWTGTRNSFIKSLLPLIVVSMCFFWKGKAKPLWDVSQQVQLQTRGKKKNMQP